LRRVTVFVAVAALLAVVAVGRGSARPEPAASPTRTYIVVYAKDVPIAEARAAILRAGGSIVRENPREELATVRSADRDFVADADASPALLGATLEVRVRPGSLVDVGGFL
jgi:hypothetical protein